MVLYTSIFRLLVFARAICWIIRNLLDERYIWDHQVERVCECRSTRLLKREEVKEWPALTFRCWHIGYCRAMYYVLSVYQIQCLDTLMILFHFKQLKTSKSSSHFVWEKNIFMKRLSRILRPVSIALIITWSVEC